MFNYPTHKDPEKTRLSEVFFDKFVVKNGLTRTKGEHSIWRLIGKNSDPSQNFYQNVNCDHKELFLKNGKPYAFVFQPYQLYANDIIHLGRFCEKHKLDCTISVDSWWNPLGTFIVIVTKQK